MGGLTVRPPPDFDDIAATQGSQEACRKWVEHEYGDAVVTDDSSISSYDFYIALDVFAGCLAVGWEDSEGFRTCLDDAHDEAYAKAYAEKLEREAAEDVLVILRQTFLTPDDIERCRDDATSG